MRDEPSGAALIEAARRALSEEVLPGLTGRPRYVALMVANALGIAAREIEAAPAQGDPAGDEGADLAARIRTGRCDADPGLHATLTERTESAARIWKPEGR